MMQRRRESISWYFISAVNYLLKIFNLIWLWLKFQFQFNFDLDGWWTLGWSIYHHHNLVKTAQWKIRVKNDHPKWSSLSSSILSSILSSSPQPSSSSSIRMLLKTLSKPCNHRNQLKTVCCCCSNSSIFTSTINESSIDHRWADREFKLFFSSFRVANQLAIFEMILDGRW